MLFKMKHLVALVALLSCFDIHHVLSSSLPGPLVYVVTPASKTSRGDKGRASPFYYHNWMRRMDTPEAVTSTTTTTEKIKTPDLIFAEFESGNNNAKSIRKLLGQEKIQLKTTTTTSRPIYVADEDDHDSNYGLPQPTTKKPEKVDMTDYFALYNNLHNTGPIYVPSAPSSSSPSAPTTTTTPTTPTTPTTTQDSINNVHNIWHIIDNEKREELPGKWEEEAVNNHDNDHQIDEHKLNKNQTEYEDSIDDNFALPGFGTNGNGGENESRAIRTEPNIRFPYVNLKPFKMKNYNSKKVNNNMFNLDSFTDIKNPVRGEVQETHMVPGNQQIDRYNPAQPYLPQYGIGTKVKQYSAPAPAAPAPAPAAAPASPPAPVNAVASLVPPPLPPAPKLTADDFPTPRTYESFPPYAPASPGASFSFPSSPDSGSDFTSDSDDGLPSGYKYKAPTPVTPPPSPTSSHSLPFIPTLPPISKPLIGYSYDKPPMVQDDSLPAMGMDEKPDFQGYHYSKPVSADSSPPQQDYSAPSYGHHGAPPQSYQPDYPELIFDKHRGHMKGGDDVKGNDMGLMPPPAHDKPDSYGPPADDHGFPNDFPGDFKYSHDFDEHDYHHHHHPTTTTTTEQPRVNRYSYYYLGKKLYYLPLYFSVYFIIYVGALIIKAVLRHKITYPNSFRPNDTTASFFSKRSIESHLSNENLHEMTGRVTKAIATAAEKYISDKSKND